MEKIGIKRLRSLKTEAFEQQPFLLCSDRKPVALIIPREQLSEEEIVKVKAQKPSQAKTYVKLPKVKIPTLPLDLEGGNYQ